MRIEKTTTFSEKELFRQKSLKKLRKNASLGKLNHQKIVLDKLSSLLSKMKYQNLLWYIPLSMEVDVGKILRDERRKHNVYVPFMEGVSFKLVKFRLPLSKKKFNIKEPMNSLAVFSTVDVAVVPVVGVDGKLRRIGFGKGMYDRFFASLKSRPFVIFVQLADCFTCKDVADSYDISADVYISPKQTIIRRGKNGIRTWNRLRGGCNKWCGRISVRKKNK